ncbi:MAG: D-2-hydroxyacid dehydrogenase [Dehalococcoidia bacterium]|nr:D-2-hydroxyacid dehydrogenase [Dehalococcoidia bacterium]
MRRLPPHEARRGSVARPPYPRRTRLHFHLNRGVPQSPDSVRYPLCRPRARSLVVHAPRSRPPGLLSSPLDGRSSVPGLLTSQRFFDEHADALARIEAECGVALERIAVPPEGRLDEATLQRVELAFFASDVRDDRDLQRRFFGSARVAPGLRWMHVAHAGTDAPIFTQLFERGVRLSTSSGETAEPIAHSAIAGLLALSRGLPDWAEAQRRHEWAPHPSERVPDDLRGQTLLVVGLGAIGNHIARLGQALGLRVVGVRRSPRRPEDCVDELHPPSALPALWGRAGWLAIACPLTEETRGLVDAAALRALPPGARIVNIARGEVVDEPALIQALRDGHLGGAYLDVFHEEPLPPDSPLWDLPRVIVSPHNASVSTGNLGRTDARFLRNLPRWLRGEPLEGEVAGPS